MTLSPTSPIPLYDQITKQIKDAILRGDLAPGQALPSIRQLAQELGTSVITVKRAYLELEREGMILTRQGLGCFVAPVEKGHLETTRRESVLAPLRQALAEAKRLGMTMEEVRQLFAELLKEEER
ncbi:GntR family transcriptional regulator [Heliobacterium undosum]|uniref:GntR family transcriptional regulator n=1 Tax=Heliomicrobium undosum TaxID=121734 RepID=A0A845L7N6_9FIRM|nr:GntR family transcriptional regulator [Heliomicrobium undosum]